MTSPYPPTSNPIVFQPWAQDPRPWETAQERIRVAEALYHAGELAAFVSMWSVTDYEAGLVGKCTNPLCTTGDSVVSSVFNQPAYGSCGVCYSTTYQGPQGGVKSFRVRPSLWTWGEDQTLWDRRGEVDRQEGNVTAPGDTWLQVRDYIFRGDGSRFQVTGYSGTHLSTGIMSQSHTDTAISYSYQVAKEAQASVAYLIPPGTDVLVALLGTSSRFPPDVMGGPSMGGPSY